MMFTSILRALKGERPVELEEKEHRLAQKWEEVAQRLREEADDDADRRDS